MARLSIVRSNLAASHYLVNLAVGAAASISPKSLVVRSQVADAASTASKAL